MGGRDGADSGQAGQIVDGIFQARFRTTEAPDFFLDFSGRLEMELQSVEQPIQLEAHTRIAGTGLQSV